MWYFGICKVTVTAIVVSFTVLSQTVKSNVHLSNRQQLKCLNDIRDDMSRLFRVVLCTRIVHNAREQFLQESLCFGFRIFCEFYEYF